jgi:hypothetical protein
MIVAKGELRKDKIRVQAIPNSPSAGGQVLTAETNWYRIGAVIQRGYHVSYGGPDGSEFKNWSGARDLNPGPHGPELCDISFRNGGNDRFLFEFVGRRRGGAVIRPDLFVELLHELLQNWLALNLPLPYLHIEVDAREWSGRGVSAWLPTLDFRRPQTVLKTASLVSVIVRQCPAQFDS